MGYTRNTGQLSYLITYDGSGNITVPASFTQTTVTSSMLKADSAGKLVAAVAGTDFVAPAGLSAYVPTTRTITINGTSYDLSADRSWSIVSGVSSFNTRTGAITLSSSDVTTALGYTPVTNARTLTINGTTFDLSANRSWSIVAGISSFNTRTGDITLLDTDVTGALGYTPVTNARTITINGTTFDLSTNRTWVVDASSVSTRVVQKFTATSGQTTFTITGGYTVGMVDVFLNGVKLDNATEFTASNGSTVVLSSAAVVNDVVEVYKYGGQFIANNSLRQTTAFTATAGQTTFTVNYSVGFVDVFYNGAKLAANEFTATNGTSIVLGTACVVGDIVEVIAYNYTVGAFTGVGGSGTTNFHPKWTASGTLGNSLIFDNGTNVGINTTTVPVRFTIANADTRIEFDQLNSTTSYLEAINSNRTTTNNFSLYTRGLNIWTRPSGTGTYAQTMIITDSGNVGIGTTSPVTFSGYSSLSVNGSTGGAIVTMSNGTSALRLACGPTDAAVFEPRNVDLFFGTNSTERMRITAGGQILTASQPAFYAYGNTGGAIGSYMVFPTVHINRGNHYNASTGVFTAPVAGVYYFSWAAIGNQPNDVYRFYIRVNNTNWQGDHQLRQDTGESGSAYATNGNRAVIVNLSANDTVRIFFTSDAGTLFYGAGNTADNYLNFFGYLIG